MATDTRKSVTNSISEIANLYDVHGNPLGQPFRRLKDEVISATKKMEYLSGVREDQVQAAAQQLGSLFSDLAEGKWKEEGNSLGKLGNKNQLKQ